MSRGRGKITNTSQGFSGTNGQVNARFRIAPVKQLQVPDRTRRVHSDPFSTGGGRDYNRLSGSPEENVGKGLASQVTGLLKTAAAVHAFREIETEANAQGLDPQQQEQGGGLSGKVSPPATTTASRPTSTGLNQPVSSSQQMSSQREARSEQRVLGRTGSQPTLTPGNTANPRGKQLLDSERASEQLLNPDNASVPTQYQMATALSARIGQKENAAKAAKRPAGANFGGLDFST